MFCEHFWQKRPIFRRLFLQKRPGNMSVGRIIATYTYACVHTWLYTHTYLNTHLQKHALCLTCMCLCIPENLRAPYTLTSLHYTPGLVSLYTLTIHLDFLRALYLDCFSYMILDTHIRIWTPLQCMSSAYFVNIVLVCTQIHRYKCNIHIHLCSLMNLHTYLTTWRHVSVYCIYCICVHPNKHTHTHTWTPLEWCRGLVPRRAAWAHQAVKLLTDNIYTPTHPNIHTPTHPRTNILQSMLISLEHLRTNLVDQAHCARTLFDGHLQETARLANSVERSTTRQQKVESERREREWERQRTRQRARARARARASKSWNRL